MPRLIKTLKVKTKIMEKSTSISAIAKALIIFHVKVGKINKDANNPFFKSKYASLSNILDGIQTPLEESGLSFVQFPTGEHGLTTLLMHGESGEYMQDTYEMKPVKCDPQGIGSAITYQRRYALAAILGLNIDDDDDANKASNSTEGARTNGHALSNTQIGNSGIELPWLNEGSKEFEGAVKKLTAGTTSIEKIKTVFKMSKSIEAKLKERSKPQNA